MIISRENVQLPKQTSDDRRSAWGKLSSPWPFPRRSSPAKVLLRRSLDFFFCLGWNITKVAISNLSLSLVILGAMVCACVLYFSSSVCKALADNILPKYKLHLFSPLRCHFCSARNRNCHTPTPEDYISSSMTKS